LRSGAFAEADRRQRFEMRRARPRLRETADTPVVTARHDRRVGHLVADPQLLDGDGVLAVATIEAGGVR
jgi:hypothetical protein